MVMALDFGNRMAAIYLPTGSI